MKIRSLAFQTTKSRFIEALHHRMAPKATHRAYWTKPFLPLGLLLWLFINHTFVAWGQVSIPSKPLEGEDDYSMRMVDGIAAYFDSLNSVRANQRDQLWEIDHSSATAYTTSVQPKRQRLAEIIGAVDTPKPHAELEYISSTTSPSKVAENQYFVAYAVRWQVLDGIFGEGLLLQPKGKIKSRIVAVPDADQTPEMLAGMTDDLPLERQYARILAENGCQVIIPTIIDRTHTGSGSKRLNLYTNQPHREWIYRQAYTFGRHVIGFEVLKILSAIDWFAGQNNREDAKIGLVGWGEGAMLAFYSSAIDTRVDATLISGYFSKREDLWKEPIYRNVFGLLSEFGDAEVASLIVPRSLIIEYSVSPAVEGPPPALPGSPRSGASAAPGVITTPPFKQVKEEVERAQQLSKKYGSSIQLMHNDNETLQPLDKNSLWAFLKVLQSDIVVMAPSGKMSEDIRADFNPQDRQVRQVKELESHIQRLILDSRHIRDNFFWNKMKISTPEAWDRDGQPFRDSLWNNVIGRLPTSEIPLNPRSRQIYDEATWSGHEVTLDVQPQIFAWGYLLLPKDLKPGEKRPTIVVQHGGSGVPAVVMDKSNKTYKGLAVQLVEQGFIVFAPHFPWRAGDDYRNLQRRANPLGLSVFSVILNQHEKILEWLNEQPWVDPDRIGFYGLSWGGKVAVRVPALLDGYRLSVCSGDFNEWIWKNATTDWPNSYMFVREYEMFDFNLGMTFNYGEMAALIAPRPFMVERGHDDGVGIDEWVAFEYAKVNRLYNKLSIPEKTQIEYFDGGHEINAKGALEFIRQHFNWPITE